MNLKLKLFLFCCLVFILGCKSNSQTQSTVQNKEKKIGTINSSVSKKNNSIQNTTKIKRIPNSDKTLELLLTIVDKTGDPATIFEYQVKDINGEVFREGVFRGTDIVWHDSKSIALIPYVGMVEQESLDAPDNSDTYSNSKPQIIKIK